MAMAGEDGEGGALGPDAEYEDVKPVSGGAAEGASDDDPAAADERRQKRMLSNRESARRSRLRKQQHLDVLRGQVAQLRAENSEMQSKYGIASRHFSALTEENRVLRSHAMDLSRRLQRLHHQAGPDLDRGPMGGPMGGGMLGHPMPHHPMAPHQQPHQQPHQVAPPHQHSMHRHSLMPGMPPGSTFYPAYSRSMTPELSR